MEQGTDADPRAFARFPLALTANRPRPPRRRLLRRREPQGESHAGPSPLASVPSPLRRQRNVLNCRATTRISTEW